MTEQELSANITRLVTIFRENKGATKQVQEVQEAEALAIMAAISASTIGCLHRIAAAVETLASPAQN